MSPTEKCVIVTGGSGLVGNAVKWAIEEGGYSSPGETWHFLSSKDADLSKLNEVEAMFVKYKPTHVLQLAAKVGGLYSNMQYGADFWLINSTINNNVLQMAHKYNAKVVSCLSTCIFPDQIDMPMTEKDIHKGPPHPSNAPYAYAKRMIDVASQAFNKQYGTCFVSVSPVNIFGPHDNFSLKDSHVLPGLMRRMHTHMVSGDNAPFNCYGSGKPLRQFIYSRDLAKIMVWMVRNYTDNEPLIACGDEEVSISELVHKLAKAMDYRGEIAFDTTKADGQFRKTCSNAKLRSMYADVKFTPMEEALNETVAWFKENVDNLRV